MITETAPHRMPGWSPALPGGIFLWLCHDMLAANRKVIRSAAFSIEIAGVVFALAGCATPGPLHVYVLEDAGNRPIVDLSPSGPLEGSSFLKAGEKVNGFAYDPFTDH